MLMLTSLCHTPAHPQPPAVDAPPAVHVHVHVPLADQAICVDCGWKADAHFFVDQGSRGTFCANPAECLVRLIPQGSRRKPQESTGFQEVVKITKDAILRRAPVLTSPNNGVEVEDGDEVIVLDRRVDEERPTSSTLFLHIQTHNRKKGWIRSAYTTVL